MSSPAGTPHRRTVFIVEDDSAVRDALGLLLSLRGHATAVFASAEDFLRALSPAWRGCVVSDIRMPGMSGLELQARLATRAAALPMIVITAHGTIAAARQALKASAIDFLEKPFDDQQLLDAIDRAFAHLDVQEAGGEAPPDALAQLSERERQVLALVVQGVDNRSLGATLGISPRTVEVHKARIMGKLGARSLVDLIRVSHGLGMPGAT